MATVHKFEAPNRGGGRQFVAHGVYAPGSDKPHSIWFSDHDGGSLVDAERRYPGKEKVIGVRRSWAIWRALERKIPGLIAQWERENG